MVNFRKMKLSTKILIGSLVPIIAFVGLLTYMYPNIKKMGYDAKRQKTQHLIEAAMGIVERYDSLVKSGQMKLPDAQKEAGQALAVLRYDQGDYFWVNDFNTVVIAHPNKDMVGKDQSNTKDAKGHQIFREFVKICSDKGGGFVDYYWVKPNENTPSPKISYVKAYQPWGWVIGTGIYVDDVERELNQLLYSMAAIAFIITFAGVFLAVWTTRSITKPINRVVEGLTDGAEQVASASSQVASAGQSLAEGASEQAAGLEETSSSIEEMASMTKQNADNATQANNLMKEADQAVAQAKDAMTHLTRSMEDISHASEETSKIIKTIDEIAFQTNLLALNAAVEAARAGEAGAGFAVVADEVRNLAMRAAEAAKNTANLIDGTVKKVKEGAGLVTKTSTAFADVVERTSKVGGLVGEITAASQEQAQGIDQISKAVAEMDKVVQQNAANAEESAAAAEQMSAQSEEMRGFVNQLFVLVSGTAGQNGSASVSLMNAQPSLAKEKPDTTLQNLKSKGRKTPPAPGKKEKADGHSKETAVRTGRNAISAEEALPLGDEDFKQF
ncbi:MAG: chemotaxis sensory transducer [Deltaproteobacteria bacterium]|nr:chemotaxis sensory transducer [Deltaproteobacteria bacterium]